MKRLWNQVLNIWQPLSMWLITALLIAAVYGYREGSLVKGYSQPERDTQASTLHLKSIINNPINAPYKVTQYVVKKVSSSIIAQRLVSGTIAGAVIILFYIIASRLVKRFAALGGTLMFATSSSLLHAGRQGSAQIMLFSLFALIVCCYAVRFSPSNNRWLLLCSAAISLSLYTPGMIYFIIIGSIWQFKTIRKVLRLIDKTILLTCLIIILASLLPILTSIFFNPSLWREFLGLPNIIPSPIDMLRTSIRVPLSIFVMSPSAPLYRLGHQATLDIFGAAMFVLGCYSLVLKRALDRAYLLLGVLLTTMVWCGISGNFENSLLLLPFIFLVVSIGVAWFVNKWLTVFPRNPLARGVAYILISCGILLSCNFQLQRYFWAWSNTPNTKAAFIQK